MVHQQQQRRPSQRASREQQQKQQHCSFLAALTFTSAVTTRIKSTSEQSTSSNFTTSAPLPLPFPLTMPPRKKNTVAARRKFKQEEEEEEEEEGEEQKQVEPYPSRSPPSKKQKVSSSAGSSSDSYMSDLITCKICLETFHAPPGPAQQQKKTARGAAVSRVPRMLGCGHNVCTHCAEKDLEKNYSRFVHTHCRKERREGGKRRIEIL